MVGVNPHGIFYPLHCTDAIDFAALLQSLVGANSTCQVIAQDADTVTT